MSDDKKAQYRALARELATDSIVTDALARLLEQVIEEVHKMATEKKVEMKRRTKTLRARADAARARKDKP